MGNAITAELPLSRVLRQSLIPMTHEADLGLTSRSASRLDVFRLDHSSLRRESLRAARLRRRVVKASLGAKDISQKSDGRTERRYFKVVLMLSSRIISDDPSPPIPHSPDDGSDLQHPRVVCPSGDQVDSLPFTIASVITRTSAMLF